MPRSILLAVLLLSGSLEAAPLTLGIVLDPGESLNDSATIQRYRTLAGEAGHALGETVQLRYFQNAFTAIKRAKDGSLDLVYGPAQVIANVGKFKFEPIVKSGTTTSASFVAAPGYRGTLAAHSGARLGMPDYESLIGSLARSEINSRGLAKADFRELRMHRMPEAPLYGIKIGSYDLAVAPTDEARAWAAANGGRIVLTSAAVPVRALAVQGEKVSEAQRQKLAARLMTGSALGMPMVAASKADFKPIASMLNTTPTVLPGAKIIHAAEAKELIAKGVPVYDVRADEDYYLGAIPGAIHVPYKEASAKEADFDPGDDQFDLGKLPRDKNAPLIMYCDGTVCWKSYKATTVAVKAGWKNIHWFRGGFPEWKDAGYPVEVPKK